jgi:DNA-binding NarL/FixJ family response regulator
MLLAGWVDPATAPLAWEWVRRERAHPCPEPGADPLGTVLHATAVTFAGGPAADALTLLHQAMAAGALDEPSLGVWVPYLLIFNDELDLAGRLAGDSHRLGQELASPTVVSNFVYLRGMTFLRRGSLAQAESDVRTSYEINCELGTGLGAIWALGLLLEVLCAAGDLEAAAAELAACPFAPDEPYWSTAILLENRAGLRSAQGAQDRALKDYEAAGEMWAAIGVTNPNVTRWRAGAARCLAHAGRPKEALDLAGEDLDLARATGLPRAIGAALHTLGTIEDNPDHVEEAIAALRSVHAPLELTRALVAHGAALRRDGRRSAAQEPLREALDLAHRCGARGLAEQARDELRIAGGRPRRPTRSGVEALTPQERRVADLAAEGHTNREIAERLFVSERTVETHLHHVFQKLTVTGRTALAAVLESPGSSA